MIPDVFAGGGGWSEGLRPLGLHDIGLEWDAAACRTRAAAGHLSIRADVAAYPCEPFAGKARGLIASPPCQAFSMAGKGHGRRETDKVHAAVELCRGGWTDEPLSWEWGDARTPLILQPLRWAWALKPLWIALEQVPPALGVWQHMADVLRTWGYAAEARVLCSADYGVPQTRNRAYLLAHREGIAWPEPTHAEKPEPSLFGAQRLPWVTMAQALGWGMTGRPYPVVASSRTTGGPDKEKVGGSAARAAIYAERDAGRWLDMPAPAICAGGPHANGRSVFGQKKWRERADADWARTRPAPSLAGQYSPDIVANPVGRRDEEGNIRHRQDTPGSVRVSVEEAATLFGFPADYPWQGNKSQRFMQIGNAVCPPMATALIGALERRRALEVA